MKTIYSSMTKYILYFDIDIACILLLSINQSMLSTFIQISDNNLSLEYRDKDQEELYCLHGRQSVSWGPDRREFNARLSPTQLRQVCP